MNAIKKNLADIDHRPARFSKKKKTKLTNPKRFASRCDL